LLGFFRLQISCHCLMAFESELPALSLLFRVKWLYCKFQQARLYSFAWKKRGHAWTTIIWISKGVLSFREGSLMMPDVCTCINKKLIFLCLNVLMHCVVYIV
jgi:hypothetical protein